MIALTYINIYEHFFLSAFGKIDYVETLSHFMKLIFVSGTYHFKDENGCFWPCYPWLRSWYMRVLNGTTSGFLVLDTSVVIEKWKYLIIFLIRKNNSKVPSAQLHYQGLKHRPQPSNATFSRCHQLNIKFGYCNFTNLFSLCINCKFISCVLSDVHQYWGDVRRFSFLDYNPFFRWVK